MNRKDIGLKDNFFNIGGNSLLAISVVEMLEKIYDIDLKLRVFFDDPTIHSLASYIELNLKFDKSSINLDESSEEIITGEI